MFVRSSRFYDALVAEHDARLAAHELQQSLIYAEAEIVQLRTAHVLEVSRIREEHAGEKADFAAKADIVRAEHLIELAALIEKLEGENLHKLVGKNVVAHIPEADLSIEGVLVGVFVDVIVLRHARIPLSGTGDIQPLGGDQNIPRDKVAWVQELSAEVRLT